MTVRFKLVAGCGAPDCQWFLSRGETLFRSRENAEHMARIWDDKGVAHGEIEEIELGYDPDEVREIGGGW